MREAPGSPDLKVALVALNVEGHRSLALGYLRAFAQEDALLGRRVAFVTLDLDVRVDPWSLTYRLVSLAPDVVAVSVACWNARQVYDACQLLRRALPACQIVLGGPEVGPIAEEVLHANPTVDAVVRGEGEETFAEVLHALLRGAPLSRVSGVSAREGDRVVSAPNRPLIADLDRVPSPLLTKTMEPTPTGTYLETYRGCPHTCAYCFEGKGERRIRSFPRERVEEEIAFVTSHPYVTSFSFIDPVFNLTRERLAWLTAVLAERARPGVTLNTIEIDVERIGPREADSLARAGVVSVETGPQSVGERALAICRRRFDPVRFGAGVAALKGAGIRVECDLIIGLPGDDAASVLEGMRFVVTLDPGAVQLSTLRVLPGTELWAQAGDLGLSFDPHPPHEVIATPQLRFDEARQLEVLGHALMAHYRAMV